MTLGAGVNTEKICRTIFCIMQQKWRFQCHHSVERHITKSFYCIKTSHKNLCLFSIMLQNFHQICYLTKSMSVLQHGCAFWLHCCQLDIEMSQHDGWAGKTSCRLVVKKKNEVVWSEVTLDSNTVYSIYLWWKCLTSHLAILFWCFCHTMKCDTAEKLVPVTYLEALF